MSRPARPPAARPAPPPPRPRIPHPDHAGQDHPERDRAGSDQAGPGRADRDQARPGHPERDQAGSDHAERDQVGPDEVGPGVTGAGVARPALVGADLGAAGVAVGLVAVAAVVGGALFLAGHPVRASAAPLFAHWLPHAGPGTPLALALAALVGWRGPLLAHRLAWSRLLVAGYATAVAWTLSLALVDGWHRGLAGRLTTRDEYLSEVGAVSGVPAMLRAFAGRILDGSTDPWTTHVAGHPPGALLVFVGLDRIGLGGGGWAALACVLVGSLVAVAVPVTVRALDGPAAARATVPFLCLFPGAVWIGASADGLFAGVTATGVALLALGLTSGRAGRAAGCCGLGGALLALGCYLSYGLTLMSVIALAVVVAARRVRPLCWGAAGTAVVVAAFTAAGFSWLDGYHLVVQRYYQGIASQRPYGYWVWANLAALVVSVGPAAAVVLRRAVRAVPRRWAVPPAACLLPLAAAAAILAADLSGLSKAETERIWLPFGVWLTAGAVLVPPGGRRGWLAVQAATALLVNHLLLTGW